ncbi:serine hydrolase domain-containing protein [Winogradskyella aurantiaca]|uniref:serine hydrolase domain-containing protein n=1 Tax=Winogradskyella aurantiaca TaxID=2219558 RepID=UPI000E1D4F29|nr:serine hydrolase [Winogradskyella aurantiaca]
MKKALKYLIVFLSLILLTLWITDTSYLLRGVRTVYLRGNLDVTIDDYTVQETALIKATDAKAWLLHPKYNTIELSDDFVNFNKEQRTIAFLVIKDGELLSETYFDEGSMDHLSGIWSISKTYTSLLLLKAQQDGLIDSIDDPVSQYLPEWQVTQEEPLTLRHLASMNTGLFWDEWDHSPFSLIAKLNFYGDLEKYTLEDLYAIGTPGGQQHYNSGGTQLLGTVLNRVLAPKTISEYLQESFWTPLNYEHDGLFILDSKKHQHEKTFGGLVSTARNVSRIGQLINNNGVWNNQQILTEADMQLIKTLPYNNTTYNYGLWTGLYEGDRFYYQAGFGGQYCISFPKHSLVITRLGHKTTKKNNINEVSPDTEVYIREALRIVDQLNQTN